MSKFNIYYKLKPSIIDGKTTFGIGLLSIKAFIIGIENGYQTGRGHGKLTEYPNGWSGFYNVDEKQAKKIYSKCLSTGWFELKLEKT